MIDIHSHFLPGVDDGARTFVDSIAILRELASQGITDVVATPHYVCETSYMSPYEYNAKLLEELKQKVALEDFKINIYLGNEIYIDEKILDLLSEGQITTVAGGKYLLAELPLHEEFQNYEDVFKMLLDAGYKVILAHPERYEIIQKDYSIAKDLCGMGVLLQCNICSIVGKYGKEARKIIRKLAKDKLIFAFGSDIHHYSQSNQLSVAQKKIAKYYSEEELDKVFVKNPRKILRG